MAPGELPAGLMPRWVLPVPKDRRVRRFTQLAFGLTLFGVAIACLIRGELGLDPWNVLHQGLSRITGLSYGLTTILVGIGVLLLWIPLRERPGLGTISNAIWVGISADIALALIPTFDRLAVRIPLMLAGIILTGLSAALYIGAGLGPGPRDGLMTGLNARGFGSIRMVRTCIEITVLIAGFFLGGAIGVGTVIFALTIGPLIQAFLLIVDMDRAAAIPRVRDPGDEAS